MFTKIDAGTLNENFFAKIGNSFNKKYLCRNAIIVITLEEAQMLDCGSRNRLAITLVRAKIDNLVDVFIVVMGFLEKTLNRGFVGLNTVERLF